MIRISVIKVFKLFILYIFISTFYLSTASAGQEHEINVRVTVIIPPCKINDNQDITVNFGDNVATTRIDGTYKKMPIEYTIDCKSATSPDLKMTISGDNAGTGFEKNVLATDNTDLGVAIYNSSDPFIINSSVNFNLENKLKLEAVLVKQKDSELKGGKFSASATMSIEYQ